MVRRSPRSKARRQQAARLRSLRAALGFSQREMAAELKVAHGAVGLWESSARPIPGPVLKLMELFEEELGTRDQVPAGRPLASLPTSFLSRGMKISSLAGRASVRATAGAVAKLFATDERKSAIAATTHAAVARQVAETLGDLKGLAMKLGQMASHLDFALPEPAREVLATLHAATRPMAPRLVAEVFVEELGASPRALFAEWSPEPFAAASVGQVHRARLESGEVVAVKVQYPGVGAAIEADLANAAIIDRAASFFFRAQEPGVLLSELRERFLEECDYRLEAANQEEFGRLWAERPGVVVPKVFPALCARRVLVSELAEGEDLAAFLARASAAERNRAGEILWDFAFESIFRHHLFNADPHPGNYLFRGGDVVFLDFGCVKRFGTAHVARWRTFLRASLERDSARAQKAWVAMGMVPDPARYDFDFHERMVRTIHEPLLLDRPYRFTPEYVARAWAVNGFENRNRAHMNVPREWVFAHRLQSGLYALLARLGAQSNWRAKILDLLYAPGEPRPAPSAEPQVGPSDQQLPERHPPTSSAASTSSAT